MTAALPVSGARDLLFGKFSENLCTRIGADDCCKFRELSPQGSRAQRAGPEELWLHAATVATAYREYKRSLCAQRHHARNLDGSRGWGTSTIQVSVVRYFVGNQQQHQWVRKWNAVLRCMGQQWRSCSGKSASNPHHMRHQVLLLILCSCRIIPRFGGRGPGSFLQASAIVTACRDYCALNPSTSEGKFPYGREERLRPRGSYLRPLHRQIA